MVDVLLLCVSWNRINTYQFYKERIYKLEKAGHDPSDVFQAYERSLEWKDRILIGVIYKKKCSPYRENFSFLEGGPLVRQRIDDADITNLMKEFA